MGWWTSHRRSAVPTSPAQRALPPDERVLTTTSRSPLRVRSKGEDPMLVRNFVYKVTARGLEQQLIDACEEATRSVARSLQHTEIYGLRTDLSGKRAAVLKGALSSR